MWQTRNNKKGSSAFYIFSAAALASVLIMVISFRSVLAPFNLLVYDLSHRFSDRTPASDILIVSIDEASILELGRWPWPRDIHAQLLDYLTGAQVKAVVLDVVFSDPDQLHPEADQVLAEAIQKQGNVVLPVHISQIYEGGQLLEVMPFPALSRAAATLGHVHFESDVDGVCRSVFLKEGVREAYWVHQSVALANLIGDHIPEPLPGSRITQAGMLQVDQIVRDYRNLIPFLPPDQHFSRVSYLDILKGKIPKDLLKDKIIYVGATAVGLGDNIVTPTSTASYLLSGVELNATIYQALRNDGFIRELPVVWSAALSAIIAFLVVLATAFMAPKPLLVFVVTGLFLTNLLAMILPNYAGLWVPPSSISLSFILSYVLWSLRRLQQALYYLRNELQQLAQEGSFLHRPADIKALDTGLKFLSGILPINGWQISQNGNVIYDQGEVLEKISDVAPGPGKWEHLSSGSSICFKRGEDRYLLTVAWQKEGVPESECCALLSALVAEVLQPDVRQLPRGPEAVTNAILRLNRANQAFREVNHLLQRSLSDMADGVAITDRSGRVLFENLQFKGLLQIEDEFNQGHVLDLMRQLKPVSDESWQEIVKGVYLEGYTARCEAVTAAGFSVLCQIQSLPVGDNETFVIYVITDISVLKEYERARTETLNFLSHDLRSPLVSILALIENARVSGSHERDDELLSAIEQYATKNLQFADSFLQLARAEATQSYVFEPVDMHAVLENAIGQTFKLAELRGIKLTQEYCDEEAWLMGHSDLLERAIINLLSNAIKFSDRGDEVSIHLNVEGNDLVCKVVDQGIGIPKEEAENIFQRFRQGTITSAKRRSGAGLGLRFVEVVVTNHAGSISVVSTPGEGSCFTIRLPGITLE